MLWSEFHTDTVVFRSMTPESDAGGSYVPRPSVGTSLACMVDAKSVNRVSDAGTILSATAYTIYFAAEPVDSSVGARVDGPECRVDDVFEWAADRGTKTLVALGPAVSMSALGEVQFKVECVERV